MTQVFTLDGQSWYLMLDGTLVRATWNSRGAALAAIEVERKRRLRK